MFNNDYDVSIEFELPEKAQDINAIRINSLFPNQKEERVLTEHPSSRFLRLYINKIVEDFGHNPGSIETIIGELSTNIERHAKSEVGFYNVLFCIKKTGEMYIRFNDYGLGFDPGIVSAFSMERDSYSGPEIRYGGFGLMLAYSLSKRINIKRLNPGMSIEAWC